jgi:hypothetical protein
MEHGKQEKKARVEKEKKEPIPSGGTAAVAQPASRTKSG